MMSTAMDTTTASVNPPRDAVEIDLRNLLAPEPLLRTLGMARQLQAGASLTVLTPRWPHPLLAALTELGLHHRGQLLADGSARICIERPAHTFGTG